VINKKIIDNNDRCKRGDVMVFRYPVDPRQDYIKRVVGMPGDEVAYLNQKLSINGQPVPTTAGRVLRRGQPALRPAVHREAGRRRAPHPVDLRCARLTTGPIPSVPDGRELPLRAEGVTCKVPPGHYFMMGDNRDNSQDSRYWGFVPDENIVGKAFFVWMNFGNLKRIGPFN
jgi:signal peptidase I